LIQGRSVTGAGTPATCLRNVRQMQYKTREQERTEAEDTDDVDERTVRALEEPLTVLPDAVDAPGMVRVVSHTQEKYTVDVRAGNCECPDAQYNLDDETDCKHVRRSRFALGLDAIPGAALDACDVEPNFGAFVETDEIRVATPDGGVIEADDGGEVLDETDETDECEACAELSDELPCFECYMSERGHDVFV
jgi:hypothetical protein